MALVTGCANYANCAIRVALTKCVVQSNIGECMYTVRIFVPDSYPQVASSHTRPAHTRTSHLSTGIVPIRVSTPETD